MRVKYSNQKQLLSCSNMDFNLSLNVKYYEQESGQQLFLFDPVDVFNFRGCSYITSYYFGPFWTPSPPLIIKNHILVYPPVPPLLMM